MPSIDIDPSYIERLAELLVRSGLTEIEIEQGEARIRVAKQVVTTVEHAVQVPAVPHAAMAAGPAAAPPPATEVAHPGTITSPMVGTAYLTPEPGASPFVTIGETVKEGQTLLIIEAMKVMNAIRAPRAGRVVRIFVENAAPVEYAEPLLVVE
jgi:acetyl-CoA carboxylase biotin carboxyl carrier protein